MTKQELADYLRLSLPTVSGIIQEHMKAGLVTWGERQTSSGGRPPLQVQIVPEAGTGIGISISRRHVRFAAVHFGAHVAGTKKIGEVYENSPGYWQRVCAHMEAFIEENNLDRARLLGIGISIPVPISAGMDRIKHSGTLDGPVDLHLIADAFPYRIKIQNTAVMAAIAQIWGIGEYDDFVYLLIGRGLGGAIASGAARDVQRADKRMGEFGHMTLVPDGRLCGCGQRGCFGSYCSGEALRRQAGVDLPVFFNGVADGNDAYRRLWEEYLDYLAIGLNNIHVIFNMNIVIGGEMCPYIQASGDKLRSRLAARDPFGEAAEYVRFSDFGEFGSSIGAGLALLDDFLP